MRKKRVVDPDEGPQYFESLGLLWNVNTHRYMYIYMYIYAV